MAPPKMRGTLDVSRDRSGASFRFRPGVLGAAVVATALCIGFWWVVHLLGDQHGSYHSQNKAHVFPLLYPLLGIVFFGAMLPLLVFAVYCDDFEGINPILPHHYFYVCKKTYRAMESGNWKITAKEL